MLQYGNFMIFIGIVTVIAAPIISVSARSCEGGHRCTPPKECCAQGCCYLYAPPSAPKAPQPNNTSHVLNLFFINHWFFWCTIFAILIAILCACSLWRKRRQICGWGSPRPHSQSGDSAGSCYAPPQYSRCNSFHHAPPPYTEVTTKPDLYPLVFTCNNSDNGKNGASYLMVQYFRNYIVRPVGSLSATSTVDSLSSSFICNANEANTLIPPPYSRSGSPLPNSIQDYASMPRSASQVCSMEQMQNQRSIPVMLSNQNNDGEQVTLYRDYNVFGGVQFRSASNHTRQIYNTLSTDDITNIPIVPNNTTNNNNNYNNNATNNLDNAIAHQPPTIHNNNRHSSYSNPSADTGSDGYAFGRNSCDLSKICDVIADAPQQQSFNNINDATIAQDLLNRCTNAKTTKILQSKTNLSYSNSTNGFFDSYDSMEDETNNYVLNMPQINTQAMMMMTPTDPCGAAGATSMREFNDLDMAQQNRHDHFNVINEQKTMDKLSSLPFSEESSVNTDMLKKYNFKHCGYNDSRSGSAVSSLANIDSPESPPQATSPTGEIRELLEQIRQLQQNANTLDEYPMNDVQSGAATTISDESSSFGFGDAYDGDESSTSSKIQPIIYKRPSTLQQQNRRSQSRTRFFPVATAAKNLRSPIGAGNLLGFNRSRISWISKSAPTTPGTAMPTSYLNDDSPLLNEHDEDAEQNT